MYIYLKKNLKESAQKIGILNPFKFFQVNDPKSTALNVCLCLLYNCPEVFKTPPYYPGINLIEHMRGELEKTVRAHHISSKSQLQEVLKTEWNKIEQSYTKKLVASMAKCLKSIISSNGYPTKY